jgi:transcriptional coactivator p15 (PC4)
MVRMNWRAVHDRSRISKHGADPINGSTGVPSANLPRRASRKAPPLAEPIIVDRWWRNRGGDAVYVRLSSFKEHNLIDIRSWRADSQGISRPGKGIALSIKHLQRLHAAVTKALAKAKLLVWSTTRLANEPRPGRRARARTDRD